MSTPWSSPLHASAEASQTPFSFVEAILYAYALRGMDPAGALRKAHIAPLPDGQWPARVASEPFERLCAVAMHELDDEAPGWFSRALPWGSYGMLARASISAPTLGLALHRWCRHHGLLTRDVTLTLEVHGDHAQLRLNEHRPLGALREFALLSLLRNAHGLACWWIDAPLRLHAVALPFAPPPYADVYDALFAAPLRFNAPQAALHFDAQSLQHPLRRDEAALNHMLRRALPLMVWPYRRERQWAPRVRQLLRERPTHTAESLAEALAASPRTLHRQLAAEGQPLQALKDAQRCELATSLLLRTRQPLAQVAQAAGFRNDKSFIRAYRAWTGETPQAVRARQTLLDAENTALDTPNGTRPGAND